MLCEDEQGNRQTHLLRKIAQGRSCDFLAEAAGKLIALGWALDGTADGGAPSDRGGGPGRWRRVAGGACTYLWLLQASRGAVSTVRLPVAEYNGS